MASSTRRNSSWQKDAPNFLRSQAQESVSARSRKRLLLYGSRKRQHPLHIHARGDVSSNGLRKPQITLIFGLKTSFALLRRGVLLSQKFLDARERPARSGSAGFDRLFGAVEIVPSQGLHIGAKNKVGVAFPNFELMFLRGTDGAADHLKYVSWRAAMAVLHADGNADDRSGAKFPGRAGRNRGDQTAVSKAARADFDRFEQAGKRAARADGIDEISLRKNDRLTRSEVRGDDSQRNAKVFKLARFEHALDQSPEAMVAGEAEARNAPTSDVAKAERAASSNDSLERRAARVGGAEDAAHAGSRDVGDRDLVLFEHLQNPEVRETARKASPEGEAHAWPNRRGY